MTPLLPILPTKVAAPSPGAGLVERSRLPERLGEGLAAGHRLLLVEAPAGYGKTTLVTAWLRSTGFARAWLSLDEGDNDPARFCAGLTAALRSALGEGAVPRTGALLASPQAPVPEALAAALSVDLEGLEQPVILVLDDYHVIEAEPVHRAVQLLLEHRPPALHVVMATRATPPLPVARWRVRGELTEVRAADLRFSREEAALLLQTLLRQDLPPAVVAALEARTEGWAAGLQLAALSLRGRDEAGVRAFVESFSGTHRYVIDYLADEVLSHLPPDLQAFLADTAVLDQLSGPLCDAVTGRSDGRATLASLEQGGLLLVPLDEDREWYRYHHLFRDVLRAGLEPQRAAVLHGRAARWLEANGQPTEAVQHCLAAGDTEGAALLMREWADPLLASGQVGTLLQWLGRLPEAQLRQDGQLAVTLMWCLFISGQLSEARRWANDAGDWDLPPRLKGRLVCVQAWLAGLAGQPETFALAAEAMALVSPDDVLGRGPALLVYGNVQIRLGGWEAALDYLREAYRLGRDHNHPLVTMPATMSLALTLNALGRRREAEALCREAAAQAVDGRGRPLPAGGPGHLYLGLLRFDAGDQDQAEELCRQGIGLCKQAGFYAHVVGHGEEVLARVLFARGQAGEAMALLRQTAAEARQFGYPYSAEDLLAVEAELMLRRGDLEGAARWAAAAGISASDQKPRSRESAYLTLVRLCLARGKWDEAEGVLDWLDRMIRPVGLMRLLISVCALRAAVREARGDRVGAAAAAEEARRLAEPEGYVRLLEDLSPPARPGQVAVGPGEHLTERELELLRLLAAGLSNEEIAGRLFISVTTAKWHIRNIYDKVGVHSRTQAVAWAREQKLV